MRPGGRVPVKDQRNVETTVYFHDAMIGHDPGPGHPECPERLHRLREHLARAALDGVVWREPPLVRRESLAWVHTPRYVESLLELAGQSGHLDPDTVISTGSVEAAQRAAGALVSAVKGALALDDGGSGSRSNPRAFALVRPPGHHAEQDRAMGFCLFNNVAVAAAAAIEGGAERVLVVDWDVHHGNGTQHIFYERSDVLVFNTHQVPLFPGSGALEELGRGDALGYTVNLPFPEGLGDGDYALAYERILVPVARHFRPDLILVSAGFDAHRDDPLGGMELTESGFAHLAGVVVGLARELCGGRIVFSLEGGYALEALVRSVQACLEVLTGATPPPGALPSERGREVVKVCRDFHRRYWPL